MLQFRRATAIVLITVLALGIFSCPRVYAQDQSDQYEPLGPDDLQQLVAPIALYPDAILAEVLVASTYPDDVIAAAQWVDAGNNPAGIDDQDWDLSVKGVAHFPDILHYMAGNAEWMNDLGEAYLNQPDDVMDAVQVLRGQALAAGSLVSNDQEQVIVDGSTIEIIPTNPDTIYVPIYNPQDVYVEPDYPPGTVIVPRIRYGPGIRVGDWLHHDLDWHDRAVYVGNWGANRPWWHHDNHGGKFDYTHDRPGLEHPPEHITINEHNRQVSVPAGRWTRASHDQHKPMPKPQPHPGGHLPDVRGRGYSPKAVIAPAKSEVKREAGPAGYDSGAAAARDSERGKESRANEESRPVPRPVPTPAAKPSEQKRPEEKPAEERPAEEKPTEHKPAESKQPEPARHALPAPAPHPAPAPRPAPAPAHQSEPSHGGAMSGYQNGQQAAADSHRGAESRSAANQSPPSKKGK